MAHLDYLKTALKDYKVAALTGSSQYTIRKIIKEIEPHYEYVIEYGAGEGVMTREILRRLPATGRVCAIERNNFLADRLEQIRDSRLIVLREDVLNLSTRLNYLGIPRIDMIISGIPFSFWAGMSFENREAIIKHAYQSLAPGAKFVAYQFTPILFPILKKFFKKTSWYYEIRNFLPYFIMAAKK